MKTQEWMKQMALNKVLTYTIDDCKLGLMPPATLGAERKRARAPNDTAKSNNCLLILLIIVPLLACFCGCLVVSSISLIAYKLEKQKGVKTSVPTLGDLPGATLSTITLAEINNNHKTLDGAQWDEYSQSLPGRRVHWTGRILDVTRDGKVYVEVDESIISYVYLEGLQKDVFESLKKGQSIEFEATIKKVSTIFLLQVWLENPELVEGGQKRTPTVRPLPSETPRPSDTPQLTSTPSIPSSEITEISPTDTPSVSPSLTPTTTPVPSTATETFDSRPACLLQKTSIQQGLVTNVENGDTIDVIINGVSYKIRYIGIDAPENQPGEPKVYFADEAKEKNRQLVDGRNVTLVRDVSDTDQQGRLLRYVFVGGLSGNFVNYEMVRQGYATAITYLPDVACTDTFRDAEQAARAGKLGLWNTTSTPTPAPSSQWNVNITKIFFHGSGDNEPDEYIEFRNDGTQSLQLKGWTLRDEAGNTIGFPEFIMESGEVCRVYTNQVHPDTCGFSFSFRNTTVWNNAGDCAYLKDDRDYLVDIYCYVAD